MKPRTSKTQWIKTLFLAALSSGLMAGCGMTPPPLPSGERVPVNHYEGQWKPAKDLSARHETPQEKAERLRQKRLKDLQKQNESKGRNPEETKVESLKLTAQNAAAPSREDVSAPVDLHAVK